MIILPCFGCFLWEALKDMNLYVPLYQLVCTTVRWAPECRICSNNSRTTAIDCEYLSTETGTYCGFPLASETKAWFSITYVLIAGMAGERSGEDIVSEYLGQNPQLAQWVDTLRGYSETSKQWAARREFILRNMEAFPTVKPGDSSSSLDRLLSLSMVWANHIFLGCR